MEVPSMFSFVPLDLDPSSCFNNREIRSQLLQYNLSDNLQLFKFRFTGHMSKATSDYDPLLREFFSSPSVMKAINCTGSVDVPVHYDAAPLKLTITNMRFFDKISDNTDLVTAGGKIRGCFDEVFHGITVGDKLRELLLNECSEHCDLLSEDDKSEVLFQLFRIVAVGGALCQPDDSLDRYLILTKTLYKEFVTIYNTDLTWILIRDSKTDTVQFSGKAFRIVAVSGLELFPAYPHGDLSCLLVYVDPIKKNVLVLKNSFKPFW